MIEKHFTLRRADGGPDAAFSLEPDELAALARGARAVFAALGTGADTRPEVEKASMAFRRSLYVVRDMAAGEPFTRENVRSIRPGYGLAPKHLPDILGARRPAQSFAVQRSTGPKSDENNGSCEEHLLVGDFVHIGARPRVVCRQGTARLIGVINYGISNLQSVANAFEAVATPYQIVTDPDRAAKFDKLVVPGVGAFGACMSALTENGFKEPLIAHAHAGKPLLGICVGMQILADTEGY